uniref:Uncharacterized protein n=1 Tax=Romanomermis culicivorax TaxID=13658 RepID=A0A915K889_ROMCU
MFILPIQTIFVRFENRFTRIANPFVEARDIFHNASFIFGIVV